MAGGQGVQQCPGNIKYRTLVFLNKRLYASCPRSDKAKISKGIVAAVRELGGRFLELDERSGTYHDIGDQKAYEKTSQALRENQTKIRRQLLHEASGCKSNRDAPPISYEGYFGYSVQVLASLYETIDEPRPPSLDSVRRSVSPCPPEVLECSNKASV